MNASASKATNRQIRRAFGEDAVETINQQGETLQSVVIPRLMTLGQTAETVDRRLGSLEQRAGEASASLLALQADLAAIRSQSFTARLRWLVGL